MMGGKGGKKKMGRRRSRRRMKTGTAAAAVYGFVGLVLSVTFYVGWLLWSLLPKEVLRSVGIHYYPSRYWAIAVPVYACVTFCAYVVMYAGCIMVRIQPPNSFNSYTDNYAKELDDDELHHYLPNAQTIPPLADIPLPAVNMILYAGEPLQSS